MDEGVKINGFKVLKHRVLKETKELEKDIELLNRFKEALLKES